MPSPPPRVSIVMPVHNGEATIVESLRSALAQSLTDFEIIVADDASSDGSRRAAASFGDPRIVVLASEATTAAGPAAARNRAIAEARGEFIAFLDADDLWDPRKLELQVAALDKAPSAALVYGWTDQISASGEFICSDQRPRHEGNVFATLALRNFIECGSNPAIRRSVLEKTGGFDETLGWVEDWDLYVRIARDSDFACVPEVLTRYRRGEGSRTSDVRSMEACFLRVVDRIHRSDSPAPAGGEATSLAFFYEYLTDKAMQGVPDREAARNALRFFALTAYHRPDRVLSLPARPWLIRAAAKAAIRLLRS